MPTPKPSHIDTRGIEWYPADSLSAHQVQDLIAEQPGQAYELQTDDRFAIVSGHQIEALPLNELHREDVRFLRDGETCSVIVKVAGRNYLYYVTRCA